VQGQKTQNRLDVEIVKRQKGLSQYQRIRIRSFYIKKISSIVIKFLQKCENSWYLLAAAQHKLHKHNISLFFFLFWPPKRPKLKLKKKKKKFGF
jgi:hypothetical protein